MIFYLSLFAPENSVSRDGFGSPIPRQPAHLHIQAESGAHSRDSTRVPRRRPYIYLNRHTPSGQSRVCRVTQMCTDGVRCRESAGTGPVNLKVVLNGCCLGRSPWTNKCAPLFPTPTIYYWYEVKGVELWEHPTVRRHIRRFGTAWKVMYV